MDHRPVPPLLRDYLLATGPLGAPGRGLGWQTVTGRPTLTYWERGFLLDIGQYVALAELGTEEAKRELGRIRAALYVQQERRSKSEPDRPENIVDFPVIDPYTATPEEIAAWKARMARLQT